MKFIDWFAGVGGFRRGLELAGHECVGFCEVDDFAVMSYTAMHLATKEQLDYLKTLPMKERQKEILKEEYKNGEWYANDITKLSARSIPRADIWCAGFPCQDVSIISSKQRGLDGERSRLFFRLMALIGDLPEEDKPTYVVLENVKNLISIHRGFDFARVLVALDEGGYDAEWQVLDSKFFGVPQHRERIFIVGHFRGRAGREVFSIEESSRPINELRKQPIANTLKVGGGTTSVGIFPTTDGRILKVNSIHKRQTEFQQE